MERPVHDVRYSGLGQEEHPDVPAGGGGLPQDAHDRDHKGLRHREVPPLWDISAARTIDNGEDVWIAA
eukprot:15442988-Alexandrium_andersonii.AAC.1